MAGVSLNVCVCVGVSSGGVGSISHQRPIGDLRLANRVSRQKFFLYVRLIFRIIERRTSTVNWGNFRLKTAFFLRFSQISLTIFCLSKN